MTIISSASAGINDTWAVPTSPARPAAHAQQAWSSFVLDTVAAAGVVTASLHAGLRGAGDATVLLVPILWLASLGVLGAYRPGTRQRLGALLRPMLQAFAACAAVAAVPALLLPDGTQRRLALEMAALLALSGLGRLAMSLSPDLRQPVRVMLVGTPDAVGRTRAKLLGGARGQRRVELVHTELQHQSLIPAQRGPGEEKRQADAARRLIEAAEQHRAEAVVLCPGVGLGDVGIRRLVWALAERQIQVLVSTEAFGAHRSRTTAVELDGLNAVVIAPPQLTGPAKAVKSAAERMLAALGVLALSPLLAAIAVTIRCTSNGPALFRQARTGLNGRHFVVYKFRTMRQGSAEQFLDLAKEAGQDSMFFKLESDPRVTRFGSFLRKTSLDELPQLFNVVLGNMALVGPRPLPAEVDQSGPDVSRRLCALPGITGQWQVSGRSSVKGDQAIEHDLDYVDNWRLGLDVSILRRTFRAVVRSDGAY